MLRVALFAFAAASVLSAAVVKQTPGAMIDFGAAEIDAAIKAGRVSDRFVIRVAAGTGIEPDGYSVQATQSGAARTITITGADARGAMYGALDVAEMVRAGRPAITDRVHKPSLRVRGYHFNLPLKSVRMDEYTDFVQRDRPDWFYDLDGYWDPFLDQLARWRYNQITLWDPHPYDRIVHLKKYPEAHSVPAAEIDRNIRFFRELFRRAKLRGIDTYLITWNIHVSHAFAKAHGISDTGQDTPLVRDYMRECVRTLIETYPDLTGMGTAPGERMTRVPDTKHMEGPEKEEWIKDTYTRAIRESGRNIPFLHRYWEGRPKAVEDFAADYKDIGPVYVELKFNGEHLYSLPTPHFYESGWTEQKPRNYRILWHLWNSDMYVMRWGDPDFVRQVVRNCQSEYSDGFMYGTEFKIPGEDRIHSAAASKHVTWKYEWQRRWYTKMLWGRLGYDADLPEQRLHGQLAERFGPRAARPLYLALQNASRLMLEVTNFHWNYMDYDWWVEGCVGPADNRQPRTGDAFHDVHEFIYNYTIEDRWLNIPEYVERMLTPGVSRSGGHLTPYDVADRVEADARSALARHAEAAALVNGATGEWECTSSDIRALAELGLYYAEKIRGATDLMFAYRSKDKERQASAVRHLEAAVGHWEKLTTINDSHYKPHIIISHSTTEPYSWGKYLPHVKNDVEIARELRPAPEKLKIRHRFGTTERDYI
ncbi:MAG TPA: hypothetical protein VN428_07195 [Bryobacteraceae bacterium]|nr:hypothetical protein [Bryobacteraceae bacterium]